MFEKRLSEYIGTKYAVALNSGTDALYLALRAMKIGQGDEVIVPSRTFVATAQVVVQIGATPVYVDVGENVLSLITEKTKAIIPVHIEGMVYENMDMISKVCKEKDIWLIEDAAQALGTVGVGNFGDIGCFSFYPAKILGAFGDAGAITTNNRQIYEWIKGARNHFKEDASDWGVNSRMDNLQAAILNVRFDDLENNLARRKEIAEMYLGKLNNIKGIKLPPDTYGRVWQDYIIRTEKRDELYQFLKDNEIETLKNNYPFPVPKLPLAQKYEDETLRLPCNDNLTDEEINFVIKKIKEFYDN